MSINNLMNDIQFSLEYKELLDFINSTSTHIDRNMQPVEVSYDFGIYNKYIDKFINIFKGICTEEQLNNLYNNLSTLKIKEAVEEKTPRLVRNISLGYYNAFKNEIVLEFYKDKDYTEEDIESVLFHELVHMASRREVDTEPKRRAVGFELVNVIGEGLNEGYTEYVTKKEFLKEEYYDTDDYFIVFLKGIETVVGEKQLQDYFFNADLPSLIDDLSQYVDRKEVIKKLYLLDKMRNTPYYDRKDITMMIRFITKLNRIKLEKDYVDGKLTDGEYQKERAIKVYEYRMARIWPKGTQFFEDENCFMFKYKDQESDFYTKETFNSKRYIKID